MVVRSLSKDSSTYLPNVEDRKSLIDVSEALSGFAQSSSEGVDARFEGMASQRDFPIAVLKVPGQEDRPLTRELAEVLLQVAEQLSKGKAVLVAPCDTRLTTQDAADMLGVSRPTLVKLLESGKIPFTKVGRHRRVLLSDLQQYARERHEENLRLFDELAADENPYDTLENPLVTKS